MPVVSTFAKNTSVPVARSRAEIETLLQRYGATSFASGWDAQGAVVRFEAHGRKIMFELPLPDENAAIFAKVKKRGYHVAATLAQRIAARDQEHRRRWRALAMIVKAKLEAVETGITTFEDEFLAHVIVPGGRAFGEWARPAIARAYDTGQAMPPLLGSGS